MENGLARRGGETIDRWLCFDGVCYYNGATLKDGINHTQFHQKHHHQQKHPPMKLTDAATPMTQEVPQPRCAHSRAARITSVLPVQSNE